MQLTTCNECGEHYFQSEKDCPHCHKTFSSTKRFSSSALLLGLVLTGCGDKNEDTAADTASEASSEPASEPAVEPPYGVPDDTGEAEPTE